MRIVRLLLVPVVVVQTFALLTGAAGALPEQRAGVVTALSGHVTVARAAGSVLPLKLGDQLYWGDIVETPSNGLARITLNGKMTVTVRALSRFHIREEQGAEGIRYTVDLLLAKVRAAVARAVMSEGEREEGRPRNAVGSIRG